MKIKHSDIVNLCCNFETHFDIYCDSKFYKSSTILNTLIFDSLDIAQLSLDIELFEDVKISANFIEGNLDGTLMELSEKFLKKGE